MPPSAYPYPCPPTPPTVPSAATHSVPFSAPPYPLSPCPTPPFVPPGTISSIPPSTPCPSPKHKGCASVYIIKQLERPQECNDGTTQDPYYCVPSRCGLNVRVHKMMSIGRSFPVVICMADCSLRKLCARWVVVDTADFMLRPGCYSNSYFPGALIWS